MFHNSLVNLLESWASFQAGEIHYFQVRDNDSLAELWVSYHASIEEDIKELRFLRRSIRQRIEMFDNMRNGVSSMPMPALSTSRSTSMLAC